MTAMHAHAQGVKSIVIASKPCGEGGVHTPYVRAQHRGQTVKGGRIPLECGVAAKLCRTPRPLHAICALD
jgi:hypothetical protein